MSGVLHILQYNRHYYLAGLIALVGAGIVIRFDLIPAPARAVLIGVAALVAFWSLGSLIASYYVYDHAGVTRWRWVPATLSSPPRQWLNIHAGLDESTEALKKLFPKATGTAIDIFDPVSMTETSIARARRNLERQPDGIGKFDALPVPDRSRDTLFLLLAAHEIRKPGRRVQLFREAARVMTNPGQILLTEHIRDWKNFLVFGPGFLHFHSRREWQRVAQEAGLSVEREGSVTPFVRWFLLRRRDS